ncbi:MAG: GatB/YqeY domain-containing protein [Myxococcales bacterium]|nr:GatB/YqeY domain-containing protein [Myxococcales bacterium]
MSIEADLKAQQIAAMKAKDSATANVIKMIRSKITERRTAREFSGEVNDELCVQVIGAYKKSLEKARVEYEKAGEKGVDSVAELNAEIAFCQQFLPQPMGEDEVRAAVQAVIADLGEVNTKMAGRIIGVVMKKHKGKVEAPLVKSVVDSLLS